MQIRQESKSSHSLCCWLFFFEISSRFLVGANSDKMQHRLSSSSSRPSRFSSSPLSPQPSSAGRRFTPWVEGGKKEIEGDLFYLFKEKRKKAHGCWKLSCSSKLLVERWLHSDSSTTQVGGGERMLWICPWRQNPQKLVTRLEMNHKNAESKKNKGHHPN